jgi:hypothetical protein
MQHDQAGSINISEPDPYGTCAAECVKRGYYGTAGIEDSNQVCVPLQSSSTVHSLLKSIDPPPSSRLPTPTLSNAV